MGIDEYRHYEILGFYINPVENHIAYRNVLIDLHERGVEEPLLSAEDSLPGIEEEIKQLYPRSDFHVRRMHRETSCRMQEYRTEIISIPI